jgi:hypothetical protein
LDARWSAGSRACGVTSDRSGQATVAGPLTDQAALHGLLAKVCDPGLPLLSIRQLDPD